MQVLMNSLQFIPFLFATSEVHSLGDNANVLDSPSTMKFKASVSVPEIHPRRDFIKVTPQMMELCLPTKVANHIMSYLDFSDLNAVETVSKGWNNVVRNQRSERRFVIAGNWDNLLNTLNSNEPWRGNTRTSLAKSLYLKRDGTFKYKDEIVQEHKNGQKLRAYRRSKGRWELVEDIFDESGVSIVLSGTGNVLCEKPGERRVSSFIQKEKIGCKKLVSEWIRS